MEAVPNPQSGRVAAKEDEVQREGEGEGEGRISYRAAVDPGLEAQFAFSIENPNPQMQMTQPGKLFVGGVSGTTTKFVFDEYFSQVRRN